MLVEVFCCEQKDRLIETLEGSDRIVARGRGGRRERGARLAPTGRCPACHAEEEAVERYGLTLLAHSAEPGLADAFIRARRRPSAVRQALRQQADHDARI